MFCRQLESSVKEAGQRYRAIALVGPRQSGKTTLARASFADHRYISFENPDQRLRATSDPKGLLRSIETDCILDEIQRVPELLSYLQEVLDSTTDARRFVLTGSNSFRLNAKLSQSLAGRVRTFTVLPLFRAEIPKRLQPKDVDHSLFFGSYPRIFDENLPPREWLAGYYETYVQKDVRELLQIADLLQFDRFIRVCATRAAQLSVYSAMASEVGISQPTATRWASVLESSFITFRLAPHFKNFGKRITKSPKIYFYDTGLLCYLLRIRNAVELQNHPLRGSVFENYVVSEIVKRYYNQGTEPPLYFWRDQHGHEIDLLIDGPRELYPIEIKSGMTFSPDWTKNLDWFLALQGSQKSAIIYGDDQAFEYKSANIVPWDQLERLVL